MKVVIITIIILVLFLSGAIYFTEYVRDGCGEILNYIEKLDEAVSTENWENANQYLDKIKQSWENTNILFEVIIEHHDLDSINKSLAKIEKYLEIREKTLTLAEITQLKYYVNLIENRETFSLSNLL